MSTSMLDGNSLLRTFVDPLHAEYGSLGGDGAGAGAGFDAGDDEADAPPSRERAAEAARAEAMSASIAGAGKLGARPPPKENPKEKAAGLFGGWGR
jgi:hypothetical protein